MLRFLRSAVHIVLPADTTSDAKADIKKQQERDETYALLTTRVRMVYFYDSLHNALLVVSFGAAVISVQDLAIGFGWLFGAILLTVAICTQVPYVIGQFQMQQRVLRSYDALGLPGVLPRQELADKLKKSAALIPTADFIGAIIMPNTAGGVLYYLLDQALKGTLKPPAVAS